MRAEVTADNTSIRVSWQWSCRGELDIVMVDYQPEGGDEASLQLSDPAATEATLTGLKNNRCYTITVVATAGEHRRESVARTVYLPLQGIQIRLQIVPYIPSATRYDIMKPVFL